MWASPRQVRRPLPDACPCREAVDGLDKAVIVLDGGALVTAEAQLLAPATQLADCAGTRRESHGWRRRARLLDSDRQLAVVVAALFAVVVLSAIVRSVGVQAGGPADVPPDARDLPSFA